MPDQPTSTAPTCSKSKPTAKPNSLPCPDCQGERQHYVRISATKGEKGQRRRVLACSVCEKESPIPVADSIGIACPKCGNIQLKVFSTRYRKGQTIRVKTCPCKNRIRTCERIEATSV